MFRTAVQTTICIGAALAAAGTVSAQAPAGGGRGAAPPPPPQKIMMIKPDLYVVTGAGGNSTVRVTKDGIILVDTKNLGDQFYNDLVTQIKTVSNQPVKEVIITHVHQDHSGNTGKFIEAGARVTANEGEKAEVATYTSPAGKPAAPLSASSPTSTIRMAGVYWKIRRCSPRWRS
jgi:glyoxylase-like metal-dependent hydrolase (beta-lactamase superfamily II)